MDQHRFIPVIVFICSILRYSFCQTADPEISLSEESIAIDYFSDIIIDPSEPMSISSDMASEYERRTYNSDVRKYLVTTSSIWISNNRESICVHYLEGPAEINIELKNAYSWSTRLSVTFTQSLPEGGDGCFEVQVPDISSTISYSLTAHMTIRVQTANEEATSVVKIRIYTEQLETYIQTDKPKYKPGQEVKFRMLSIKSPSMKVVKEHVSSIFIEAPNGFRIMQWDDVKADEGLVDLQMKLSDEPMLGTWKINAEVGGRKVTQTFVVEKYVLPKFEVLMETPKAVYLRDNTFKVKICGLYTYGQPVRGSINATICFKYTWEECPPETTTVKQTDDTGSDGCEEFDLTSEELKWDQVSYYYHDRLLFIDANFTEAGTDVTLSGSSLSTKIKETAVDIEIKGFDYYKPGFEYNGKVIITNADGSRADGVNMTITVTDLSSDENIDTFNEFSDNGVVTFNFDAPTDTSIGTLDIKVAAEGYETNEIHDALYGYYRIANNPYATKRLTAFYSPSGSFLNIKPVPKEIEFGSVHNFEVKYTVSEGESRAIDVKYLVLARSVVAKSGNLIVQTPSCSHKAKRDIAPFSMSYDYYNEYPPKPKNDVLAVLGLNPLPTTCRLSFILPIDITHKMSPNAKLLIYYARKDEELVADSIEFTVVKGLSNQVSMDFEDEETRPGESTTLNVQSEANSLCAFGIVDKSVELLGTTNKITNDRVFNTLSTYSYDHFYYTSKCNRERFSNVQPHPEGILPKPMPTSAIFTLRTSTYTSTKHADSVTVFQNAGVLFASSFNMETRPCYLIRDYYWVKDFTYYSGFERVYNEQTDSGPPLAMYDVEDDTESMSNEDEIIVKENTIGDETVEKDPPVKIRTYFPETLLWQLKRTNEDGETKFDLNVPDTITDWKASGFCISPDSDIGIAETTTLRAFKPFFVSITLPYSVIRNENVPLKITVFNYLADKCLMVKLTLTSSTNFTTLGNDYTRRVCVCGGSSKTVQFRIVPRMLGNIPVTVSAVTRGFNAVTSKKMCDGEPTTADRKYVGLTDGVQRDLLVEPEGIEKDVTQSSIICLGNGEQERFSYMVDFPKNTVTGSARVKLQVIGDIMGPALNNLNYLIRLPTGCGEQNIVKMAPNIYVLQYLINTRQITDQLKETIIRNIEAGYQRELNYRRQDGSYSAFGSSDRDGSTWLTAFVLRTFAESGEYIKIDDGLMSESLQWLVKQQNKTSGCVMSRGRLFNKAMKGGVSDEITLTAYTLITMIEAGDRSSNDFINKASECLVSRWNDLNSGIRDDPYSVALLAYAFKLSNHHLYNEVLGQLNVLAINEDGLKHWERPASLRPKNPCYYCQAPSAEVEMTSYALLALDLNVDDNQVEGLKISRWLARQQNAYGGYASTQDTVIALKALAYFAEVLYAGEATRMSIRASSSAGGEVQTFEIDSSNLLLLQRMDIEKAPTTVEIDATGSGCALVQVQSLYNIYEMPAVEVEPFAIAVKTTPDEKLKCEKQTMRISVSYNGDDIASSMAIVEVKLVSGYYADKHSLEKLSKDNELNKLGFKKYEVNGNVVDFYFDEFTSKPIVFEFDVIQEIKVKNPKRGYITVYDYYEAELKSVVSYKPC